MSSNKFKPEFLKTPETQYIRVGIDYFKVLNKIDRYGIKRTELKKWSKEEIKLDHGGSILTKIEKFDDFIIIPDNKAHRRMIDNFYNLYSPFPHKPKEGSLKWTEIMLGHVFGDQIVLGVQYLQVLYLYPKQALPVLLS